MASISNLGAVKEFKAKDGNEMRNIVISVDYEIFGNGTGDVRRHVIDPTARMAEICERNESPLTIFFEVEEYLAFRRYRDELKRDLGYDPANEIREQLISLLEKGHDVQLHLHPDWYGCRYDNGNWILDRDKRAVDFLFSTKEETISYIRERKQVIEEMRRAAEVDPTVSTYRAGAFWAQPGEKLLPALAANDIWIDSSVVCELHRIIGSRSFDFRGAPMGRRHWKVCDEVSVEDNNGAVWEFPIYSRQHARYRQITWKRLMAKFSRNVPRQRQKEMVDEMGIKGPYSFVRFLTERFPEKFDYHNLSPEMLHRWAKSAERPEAGELDVLVSIGHTKEHMDDEPFARFVSKFASDSDLKVIGFNEVAEMLERDPKPKKTPESAVAV